DRVVLRAGTTVGGAVVLDPAPPRRVDVERDRLLGADDPASIVRALVDAPVSVEALAARALLDGPALEEGLDAVRVVEGWAFSEEWLEATAAEVEERLRAHAEASPLDPGLASSELLPAEPWAPVILGLLPVERRGSKLVLPGTAATLGARADAAAELERELTAAGLAVSKVDDGELARFLEGEGRVVRVGDGFAVSSGAYQLARHLVVTECGAAGEISLARFRDLAGVGRRDAQVLLERMDADGVTRRIGDRRVLRRSARVDGG
ncbi:MAG: SelB C-terminal domain-containing protein, partial [Gaiella sp.]